MNLIKSLWCRFEPCLGTFTMLLLEGSSEAGLFRHLPNHVLRIRSFGNTKAVRVIFFSKMFKIESRFQKCIQKLREVFCLWDNCFWIDIVKMSLFRTGYFSSAADVLTSSSKIWHVNKRDFFQLNWFVSDWPIWSRWRDADLNRVWARFPCWFSKGPLKRDFLDIYLTTFSDCVISEIQKLWGSSFIPKS